MLSVLSNLTMAVLVVGAVLVHARHSSLKIILRYFTALSNLFCAAAALALALARLGGVPSLLLLLFKLQALGSVSRLLKARGRSRGWRVAVLILLLTLAQDAACLIGAASLYFGTQGVISSYIRKKRKEHEEDE